MTNIKFLRNGLKIKRNRIIEDFYDTMSEKRGEIMR